LLVTNGIRTGVFFACDTGSSVIQELRSGLEHLIREFELKLIVFDVEAATSDIGVMERVEDMISRSLCLVADVGSDPTRSLNGNVMMEIGLARGLGRPILLIAKDPDKLPSNLKGQDIVMFPECLRVGSNDYVKTVAFFQNLGRGLLAGKETKIFHSQSADYLDILRRINELPGDEWFRAPELRSFLRPEHAEIKWLREVRRISRGSLEREIELRSQRRRAFEANLGTHSCADVYPLEAVQLKTWRGMPLGADDRAGFLRETIPLLDKYASYEIIFVEQDDREKYWIKDSTIGKYVIFEGWGYVDIRKQIETGGLVISDPAVVSSYASEFRKLQERRLHSRSEALNLLRRELEAN
jgi:hypothetical protein